MANTSSNDIWLNWSSFKDFELRAFRFRDEMLPLFYQYLGITPHSYALDAGCGTGVLARYLAKGLEDGRMTGFDINESAIAYGRTRLGEFGLSDKVTLDVADGFNLRYDDGSFDAVTNYTYIGVLSDPVAGLRELIRVCKPGGVISCVVATNGIPPVQWHGDYPFEGADELQALATLEGRIFTMYVNKTAQFKQNDAWSAFRYPRMFDACGLRDIRMHPFSYILCYSDAQYPLEYRRIVATESVQSDINWITGRYKENQHVYAEHGYAASDFERTMELMRRKLEYLKAHFDTDNSYEWFGGYNFIVTGIKP